MQTPRISPRSILIPSIAIIIVLTIVIVVPMSLLSHSADLAPAINLAILVLCGSIAIALAAYGYWSLNLADKAHAFALLEGSIC